MDDAQAVELLRAIRDHAGLELSEIRDAGTHGADSGFHGFIYTGDGANFTRDNQTLVWQLLEQDAEEYEFANIPAFVASFARADMAWSADGFDCLLAWYALEKAGLWLDSRRENRQES